MNTPEEIRRQIAEWNDAQRVVLDVTAALDVDWAALVGAADCVLVLMRPHEVGSAIEHLRRFEIAPRGWLDKIAFEDMLELASLGAKVLQVRSVELGMVHNMPVFVRSSFDKPEDIDPHGTPPGTLICSEEEIMESHVVTGIAFTKDEAQISLRQIEDKPGVAAAIFGPLADANINVDMIVQNVSEDGKTTDLTFTVPASDYNRARDTITSSKAKIGYVRLDSATDVSKVSVIGSGMRSHAGVAAKAFKALSERNINIRAITTSEIKFSVLIDAAYTELAVRTLHTLYGLDQA